MQFIGFCIDESLCTVGWDVGPSYEWRCVGMKVDKLDVEKGISLKTNLPAHTTRGPSV